MARNTRIAPMPVDDFDGIFEANHHNIELTPGSYTHVADWMRMAVTMACGPTTTLGDVLLFAQIWSLTHNGNDTRTHATRSWFAARMCVADVDTVTESANHLAAAGLIKKENETCRKLLRNPETGRFAPADVPTTNWRLSIIEDSPAVQAALAWERGELEEQQHAAALKYRAVNQLNELSAFGADIIDHLDATALAAITDEEGNIKVDLLAAAVTTTLASMGIITTADSEAEESGDMAFADASADVVDGNDESVDPEGWAELVRVTRNKNLIDAAKEPYRALLAKGDDPDVIKSAWISRQNGIEEDRYSPQLLKWLMSEAQDGVAREEERRRKISGDVDVDVDDVLSGFDADSYKARLESSAAKDADALDGGSVDRIIEGFKQRR